MKSGLWLKKKGKSSLSVVFFLTFNLVNLAFILIIFFMGRPAIKALKDYEAQKKAGVTEYEFDPKKLGIKNADFWEK